MTSPHNAERCTDADCLLPRCINQKMRILVNNQQAPKKRNTRRARTVNIKTRPSTAGRGSSGNGTLRRKAQYKSRKLANAPRTLPSPAGANAASSHPVEPAARSAQCVGNDNLPKGSMTREKGNITGPRQLPATAPNADHAGGWILLNSSMSSTADETPAPAPVLDAEELALMESLFPDLAGMSSSGIATNSCWSGNRAAGVLDTGQDGGLPETAPIGASQANPALPLPLLPSESSFLTNACGGSTRLNANRSLHPALFGQYALPTSQHTGPLDPEAMLMNSRALNSHVDTLQRTLAAADPPMPAQRSTTCNASGRDLNNQFSRIVLSYIRRLIMTLEQPRVNKEAVICILKEAASNLQILRLRTWRPLLRAGGAHPGNELPTQVRHVWLCLEFWMTQW